MTLAMDTRTEERPVLLIPYQWIGDFVRCHSVVKLIKERSPDRPVDVLTSSLCAPLLDYMPGIRRGIVVDLPRGRLAYPEHRDLAERLKHENYGTALIMSRKWKAALAPWLAGIPERVGFVGEMRFGLLSDVRFGEKELPRMIDRCAVLALRKNAARPSEWPLPELVVPADKIATWRQWRGLVEDVRPLVVFAPGAVGPSKRWPTAYYAEAARKLADAGMAVWVVGGPSEKPLAAEIIAAAGPRARDLTGEDLRNAILALADADAAVSNDSGLLHVAAAIGTPAVGIFGPTSPWHWAPLNPISAVIETRTEVSCRPCHKPTCRFGHHRCMREIPAAQVIEAVRNAL
jgi:heptosyltransferase-2